MFWSLGGGTFIIFVWDFGSSLLLTNFKLVWNTATLLPVVATKHIITIWKWTPFLQCHAAILLLHLVVWWINWVIFHLKFILNYIPILIFAQYVILRLFYCVLSLLGRYQMHLWCPDYLLVITGHSFQCVSKQISYWVRQVLSIAKVHMSVGALQDIAASVAYAACVFGVQPADRLLSWD